MTRLRHFIGMACLIPGLVLMGAAFGLLGIPVADMWRQFQASRIPPLPPPAARREMVH